MSEKRPVNSWRAVRAWSFMTGKASVRFNPTLRKPAQPRLTAARNKRCNPSVTQTHGQYILGARALKAAQQRNVPGIAAAQPGPAATAPAMARASPKPRLTPCPASGCTTCAASPMSATRGLHVLPDPATCVSAKAAGGVSRSSLPRTYPRRPAQTQAQKSSRRPLAVNSAGMCVVGWTRRSKSGPREGQIGEHPIGAKPLQRDAAMGPLAGEIRDHAHFAVRPRLRFEPASRLTHEFAPSAPTSSRA